ncbi:MAG: triose-phosphate isomerase [Pseudohongiellaceae bacterium]
MTVSPRSPLIIGNWKMHGTIESVQQLLDGLIAGLESVAAATELAVCPSFVHLGLTREALAETRIATGAQNAHAESAGAFTGEVAAAMLAELGLTYVLVGHSERRQLFAESDADVAAKFAAVQQQGLIPVLCLGETLTQREQGETEATVLAQLNAVLDSSGIESLRDAVIAYEPVWAIGTGKTASPEQAQQVHRVIREHLAAQDSEVAARMRILYGGSVKSSNAGELFSQPDIDGGLVGGASLKADEFIAIATSVE